MKKEVEAYMSAANEYLECRMPRNKHNRMVAKMEKTAKKFNSLLKAGTYVYFEVKDEGVGISEEDQVRLFEPFYTTKFTGRGLGMAVVFGIIRVHRGAIEISSELEIGTTVRAYFPATEGSVASVSDVVENPEPTVDQARGAVLVVDDEPYVRDLMRNMIKTMGFTIFEAEDGHKGLAAFSKHQDEIKCCILDLTMPGMGGVELLKQIRALPSEVPVLIVSGYSQQEIRQRDLDATNVVFLQKPFTLAQFQITIRGLL
ncbi:MAG: response regulator [Pseudomonadales bacterium]